VRACKPSDFSVAGIAAIKPMFAASVSTRACSSQGLCGTFATLSLCACVTCAQVLTAAQAPFQISVAVVDEGLAGSATTLTVSLANVTSATAWPVSVYLLAERPSVSEPVNASVWQDLSAPGVKLVAEFNASGSVTLARSLFAGSGVRTAAYLALTSDCKERLTIAQHYVGHLVFLQAVHNQHSACVA
jgi:hypothetical protein